MMPMTGEDSSTPSSGVRGWLHTKYHKFRSAWKHADSGALLWMRLAWDWLHSWTHPDETMLARLWSAAESNCTIRPRVSQRKFAPSGRITSGRSGGATCSGSSCNGMIAPLAVVTLWILPGPNLIGYWFAYRAIHHSLVVWGIRKVQRQQISTELHPVAALDLPLDQGEDGKMRHLALTGQAVHLDEHVAWHDPSRAKRVRQHEARCFISQRPPEPSNFHTENSPDR